jgi:hypothetical protein
MPRWVKVFILLVLLVILLVVVIMVIVGGDHGPGRHAPGILAGFALLVDLRDPKLSTLEGGTTSSIDIPSEGGHE